MGKAFLVCVWAKDLVFGQGASLSAGLSPNEGCIRTGRVTFHQIESE
jgi:hypothetical protein